MKKSKLIDILNKLPGNVDVRFWNAFVGDWMEFDPKPVPLQLVKKTEEYFIELARGRGVLNTKDINFQLSPEEIIRLKKVYKGLAWEDNQFITIEDIKEKRYKAKTVYMIQPKERGVTSIGGYHQPNIKY